MQNLSYENEFYLHVNIETHFHLKGYAPRLALKKEIQGNSEMAYSRFGFHARSLFAFFL